MALMRKHTSDSSSAAVVAQGVGGGDKRRQRTLAKQQQISESIAGVSMTILENAQESVSAIEELKSSMEQIATAAEENSGASEQALANVKAIDTNISRMNLTINTVISSTLSTGENIMASVGKVNDSVGRMARAVQVAQESSTKSEELKISSQNIGDAVGFIAKIADQTNLLALNAAIEASRAKEHGKGFAVVADETRALAGESEKNAEFISELVTKIQGSIDNIIQSIGKTTTTISDNGSKGNMLSAKMEELTKIAVYSVEAARSVNTYTQRLGDFVAKINDGSQEIATASSEIALSVEKTLNGIDIQSEALAQTEDDIKELSNLAEELKYSTDTMKSAEDIAMSADTIGGSMEDIQNALEDVTTALNQIESSSHTTNKSALRNKELIEAGIDAAKDIDKLIEIARRNFDLLKVSFNSVKNTVSEIRGAFSDSISQGNSAAAELSVIVKDTRNVDKTVGNISNSIVQLNMLAISGSIEAARAGDFGKGFAVVSSDIRNLAKDSESNTDKINDIVESMNSEIDTVRTDWNNLLASQGNEQSLIDILINDIVKITDMLVDLLDRYTGLKAINDQNLEGMNQVVIGISEIQKAVELSARNAMESRKASELIIETVSHIGEGVEELAVMADELQQG
ncbi:methyl-accepting chemotaxis protein [Sulfurimonas gotlandica GD1]|uniref:Methyl-accepting chemotaxis protein n=1 Tax=Sulfurimonas gotlandica (strain DSM 19862 / JCM 16533 / GD1) TaxID=929558 RepID=B6BNV9_SULGG|nr:methyl-accepting chemotaxis protein [Sulfurimonas gotlandica]EDZ61181.1 chemotaxis sensory transducer, putative [Sulfurimonas gotlandica GD1]EHP28913.1 methyl-accepting chemotaxis protein [Sulfurimonas gotlandica GD1]